jgi:hypothetical protein
MSGKPVKLDMPKRIPLSARTPERCLCGCGEYVPLGPHPSTQNKYIKGHRYIGKSNPNYKGGKVELVCPLCGLAYLENRCHAERRVSCGRPGCYAEVQRRATTARGLHLVTVPCNTCGAALQRFPSLVQSQNFCNAVCRTAGSRGSRGNQWKGGGPDWLSAQARVRDGAQCVVCGWGLYTEVHHITPRHRGGADTFSNLVTLCPNHHRLAQHRGFDLEPYRRTDWLPEGYVEPAIPTHGPRPRPATVRRTPAAASR